jgi:hypothetical protein
MRPENQRPNHARRPEKSSWWLLLVCALLLASSAGAAPLSLTHTRQSSAQAEAVFAMLRSVEAADAGESKVALQVLCARAGLDDLATARLLSSYERWTHAQKCVASASTCSVALLSSWPPRTHVSRSLRITERFDNEAPVRTHARICLFLE